jgi:signal transduction histidine kinase/DNA-binding response OmpR family regulator
MNKAKQRDNLLNTVARTATVLLAAIDEEEFTVSLLEGMELMGRCVNVDRVRIWQNEIVDGDLYYVHKYEWLNSIGQNGLPLPINIRFPYRNNPEWENKFLRNECICGPLSKLTENDKHLLNPYNIKSVLLIPLFFHGQFWGFFGFDDCHEERFFEEDEVNILRSAGLMLASAMNRNERAEKIREAHGRTKLLLDAMPIDASLWDRNFKLFDCNKEAILRFNLKDKQEYLDRFFEFSPKYQPDGQLSSDLKIKYLKKAFEEGKCVYEWMHQMLDGTPVPSEITLVRVSYGDDYVIASYTRDLREHKQMMKEIEQRNNLLRTVNRTVTVLLATMDEDKFEPSILEGMESLGNCVDVDRIYIWRNEIIDGELYYVNKYGWLNSIGKQKTQIHPGYKEAYKSNPEWESKLLRNECINRLYTKWTQSDQDLLSSHGVKSILVIPLFLQDKFWGFFSFDNCHMERIFTEYEVNILRSGGLLIANALMRYDMTLDIRSTAAKLEVALKDAQEANNAKSNFLAKMSHEMRTPLNAIIGLSEIIFETGGLSEETFVNLEKIYNAGKTLLSTVNDILDISKIEAGKFELVPIKYDFSSLINDTINQSIPRIGEKPIEFVLNLSESMPMYLYGDELRTKQIIINLLSNAFKYTNNGTVELDIQCAREGDSIWITVYVRDTGIGIRSEDFDSLFTDYVQLNTKFNNNVEGTGLGLHITKRLVEMMDGSISVESEYGKGSIFSVKIRQKFVSNVTIAPEVMKYLAGLRYSENKRSWSSQLPRISLPYARVLLVDDIIINLDVIKGMMKPYGMQTDCVTSGQQAIDAIRTEKVKYNAIFMDHMMPEIDGIETTRIIRKEIGTEYAKNIPIIAVTANAIVGNEEMFLRNGFQAFISKPIETNCLDTVIRQWVWDRKLEEEYNVTDQPKGTAVRSFPWRVNGIDMQKGFKRFDNNEESFLQVLHSYEINTRPILEAMEKADQEHLAEYAILAHGISGSSYGICADTLGDKAKALEKAANARNFDFVSSNNNDFLRAAWKLVTDIEKMLDRIAEKKPKPKKEKPDLDVLSKLLFACKNYDMDGVDAAMAEIETYEYESNDGLAIWLRENVDHMNFAQIIEKLLTVT